MGILYVAQNQLRSFQHVLDHRKLFFQSLATKEICVYVGPQHPRYNDQSIEFSELSSLNFIRGVREFFSIEHHLEHFSLGAISSQGLNHVVYSNSDHVHVDFQLYTDVCSLGIDFLHDGYAQYPIHSLRIKGCEPFLEIGYLCSEGSILSEASLWFIERFKKILQH